MRRRMVGILPLVAVLFGCDGNAIQGPAGEGGGSDDFRIVLIDDPDPGDDPTIVAELDGAVRVALRNDADALVDLGLTDDVVLTLQEDGASFALDVSRPPADTYVAVRISFEGVGVDVAAGSVVGGRTLTNTERIDLGETGQALLEIDVVPFTVSSASTTEIVIDLNAEQWITEANLDAFEVPQDELGTSVTVEIE